MSTSTMYPRNVAIASAAKMPRRLAFIARLARSMSPMVVAKERATFGPRSGAMTMAPIMIATLPRRIPIAATTVDSITMMR